MFLPPVQSPASAPPRPASRPPAPVTPLARVREVAGGLRDQRPPGADPRPLARGPDAFRQVAELGGGELLTLGGRLDLYA